MSKAEKLIEKLLEASESEYEAAVAAIDAFATKLSGRLDDVQWAGTHGYGEDIEVVAIAAFFPHWSLYKKGTDLFVGERKTGKQVKGTPTWSSRAKKKAFKWLADNDPSSAMADKFEKGVGKLPKVKKLFAFAQPQTYSAGYSSSGTSIEVALKATPK